LLLVLCMLPRGREEAVSVRELVAAVLMLPIVSFAAHAVHGAKGKKTDGADFKDPQAWKMYDANAGGGISCQKV
jgi:hypothetical protein